MARKGVLLSSPDVQNMSIAQWIFEYHALQKKEHDTFDVIFKCLKNLLVGTLGLNVLRPVDEKGVPKSVDELTEEEREMFLPLTAWVARPDMLKQLHEQMSAELEKQREDADAAYERLVQAIDDNDGDMEPILGPIATGGAIKNTDNSINNKIANVEVEDV